MSIEILINQQQTTIKMLETFAKLGRCSVDELDQAREKLRKLVSEREGFGAVAELKPLKVLKQEPSKVVIVDLALTPLKQELLSKARALRKQQAELSNELHLVPNHEHCSELTGEIIDMGFQIEGIWTKYRYLERNGVLPEEHEEVKEEKSVELLRLESERKKFCEERSKLKKKLEVPGTKSNHKEKWVARKWVVDGIIQDLDAKIKVLK